MKKIISLSIIMAMSLLCVSCGGEVLRADIQYIGAEIEKNILDENILIVEYEFSHNSKDNVNFINIFDDKAYQGGVELSNIATTDSLDTQQRYNNIKADSNYKLKVGYVLQDTTTSVDIEIKNHGGTVTFLNKNIDLSKVEILKKPLKANIKILSTTISKNYKDKPTIIVEYEFTNLTDKPKAFLALADDKVYQNGIECDTVSMSDDIDVNQQMAEVKPNIPYIVKIDYLLQDIETPIDIEISELLEDEPYFTQTINLN